MSSTTGSRTAIIAALLSFSLGTFAILVIRFVSTSSATSDELIHLPAGYTYLRYHDYRMDPEHPPLIKKLAALPLLFRPVRIPQLDVDNALLPGAAVTTTSLRLKRSWALGLVYDEAESLFGHALLYGVGDETTQRFRGDLPHFDAMMVPTTVPLTRADFVNDADDLLFWGRVPILVLGAGVGLFVFLWARNLFGLAGAVLPTALFCFEPNFIAHSGLVTTDIGVTLFMFGTLYFLWRAFRCLNILNVIATSIFVGLALASKFSALLLVPIFVLLAFWKIIVSGPWKVSWRPDRPLIRRPEKALAVVGFFACAAVISYAVLWAMYDFRFCPVKDLDRAAGNEKTMSDYLSAEFTATFLQHPPGYFPTESAIKRLAAVKQLARNRHADSSPAELSSAIAAGHLDPVGKLLLFANQHRLLPDAYVYGAVHVASGLVQSNAFLRGRYSSTGFGGTYFLWTFLLKTPVVTMILIIAGLIWLLRDWKESRAWAPFLLIPVAVYLGVALGSNMNIGHRHLLPIFPFLFVMSGALTARWEQWQPKVRFLTATIALALIAASSSFVFRPFCTVYPHYLAYFNEFAGGPPNGYKSLVDSNLDWGQDLKGLKTGLAEAGIDETAPLYLCYFGEADPRYYGIPHINLAGGYPYEPQVSPLELRSPCYLAISATNLQGLFFPPELRDQYSELLKGATLVTTIGYSIFVYSVPKRD